MVALIKIHLSKVLGTKRMTQAELARRTDIRPNTINEIYHELIERINLEHLDKICEVLDCEISDLIEYVPKSRKDNNSR
ncbi:helix-turn-helix domain-containing protein [Metasolibacillus meyeri]|uniref:helix-turn-helix domain-containing protein n=1 Tax=Metasolibacillus meyeri TaxID=1071052 RepID=UPI00398B0011